MRIHCLASAQLLDVDAEGLRGTVSAAAATAEDDDDKMMITMTMTRLALKLFVKRRLLGSS